MIYLDELMNIFTQVDDTMLRRNELLLTFLLVLRCQGYVDEIPDPDFSPTKSHDSIDASERSYQDNSVKTEKLSGHFKLLINQILERNLLTKDKQALFRNADKVDPYSITETILELLSDQQTECPPETRSLTSFLYNLDYSDLIQELAVTYIITVFCICYWNKKCCHFLVSLHGLIYYLYAVYSRINKQFGELKGKKLAAMSNIPPHCKEHFSISSVFSLTWSKFQIGDQCGNYHQEVMTDPIYEIQYLKCFVYPFVSVLSTPLTVLGEELGPFLENVLTPFPFHLQIFILVFVSIVLGGLITLGIKVITQTTTSQPVSSVQPESTSTDQLALIHKEMMQELVDMKRKVERLENNVRLHDVTDIMLLNESTDASLVQRSIVSHEESFNATVTS